MKSLNFPLFLSIFCELTANISWLLQHSFIVVSGCLLSASIYSIVCMLIKSASIWQSLLVCTALKCANVAQAMGLHWHLECLSLLSMLTYCSLAKRHNKNIFSIVTLFAKCVKPKILHITQQCDVSHRVKLGKPKRVADRNSVEINYSLVPLCHQF